MDTSTVVGFTVQVAKLIGPQPLRWVQAEVWGQRLLVVGPSGAGKSTFIDVLASGHFPDHETTAVSQGSETYKRLRVEVDGTKHVLTFRRATALPGTNRVGRQAGAALCDAPDIVVAMTDGSKPAESADWLSDFCKALCNLADNMEPLDRPHTVICLANKHDLCTAPEDFHNRLRRALKAGLVGKFGFKPDDVTIKPTIMVRHEKAPGMFNDFLHTLAHKACKRAKVNGVA